MVVVNGYVSKGSEEYTERMAAASLAAEQKRTNSRKKKYAYFYTNTSSIMLNGFQNIDEDTQLGTLEMDINVNCLDDFENSIIRLIDKKHSKTLKDAKLFKSNAGYTFFSKIPNTNYIYVDKIKIERIEEI